MQIKRSHLFSPWAISS